MDVQALEVEAVGQVEIIAGDFHGLINQGGQVAGRQLTVTATAEIEHMADDLRCATAGLLDAVEQAWNLSGIQVAVDVFEADAGLFGLFAVLFQLG